MFYVCKHGAFSHPHSFQQAAEPLHLQQRRTPGMVAVTQTSNVIGENLAAPPPQPQPGRRLKRPVSVDFSNEIRETSVKIHLPEGIVSEFVTGRMDHLVSADFF